MRSDLSFDEFDLFVFPFFLEIFVLINPNDPKKDRVNSCRSGTVFFVYIDNKIKKGQKKS